MNIITKIKNWLIHILGGYTEEEYTDVVNHAEEPWFELAKEYHDKYNTEHENYLALLNCHNASVEQKQKMLTPIEMLKGITAYCDSKDNCDVCEFYKPSYGCKIHNIPCYWEVE